MTHLFCNWKFVTLHFPSIYFSLPPSPSHLATTCLFSVSVTLFLFCFVHLLFSLFTFHQGSPKIVFLSLCMLSHFSHVQLFVTPGSSVHGILQARILELGYHDHLQGIFPTQGSNLCLMSLALTGRFFTISTTYK